MVAAAQSNQAGPAGILLLSNDEALEIALRQALQDDFFLLWAADLGEAQSLASLNDVRVLVADTAVVGADVGTVIRDLQQAIPGIVTVAVGNRSEGPVLLDLVNHGTVYRLLCKPIHPGQARLFIEAACRQFPDEPHGEPAPAPPAESSRIPFFAAVVGGAGILAAGAAAWFLLGGETGPPAESTPGERPAPPVVTQAPASRVIVVEPRPPPETAVSVPLETREAAPLTAVPISTDRESDSLPVVASPENQPAVATGSEREPRLPADRSVSEPVESTAPGTDALALSPEPVPQSLADVIPVPAATGAIAPAEERVLATEEPAVVIEEPAAALTPPDAGLSPGDAAAPGVVTDTDPGEVPVTVGEPVATVAAVAETIGLPTAAADFDAQGSQDRVDAGGVATVGTDEIAGAMEGGSAAPVIEKAVRAEYVAPEYPRSAQARGLEGFVQLEFTIDTGGDVRDIVVVDSKPGRTFDRVAKDALAQWKYRPRTVDGEAVAYRTRVQIDFALED